MFLRLPRGKKKGEKEKKPTYISLGRKNECSLGEGEKGGGGRSVVFLVE